MSIEYLTFTKSDTLSVLEVRTDYCDSLDYISSTEAYEKNFIEIKEINEGGSVNKISVNNKSEYDVFFMDGDIFIGAKQNRVINSSAYIPAKKTVNIDVSCIEQGRWRYKSERFSKPDYILSQKMRYHKKQQVLVGLRRNRGHISEQRKVWKEINEHFDRSGLRSQSDDFSELIEKINIEKADIIKNFIPSNNANGMVIFIGDEICNFEIFNRKNIYTEYNPRLLKSLLLDFNLNKVDKNLDREIAIKKSEIIIKQFENQNLEIFPALCAGIEKRFAEKDFTFYQLEYETKPVHFSYINNINNY